MCMKISSEIQCKNLTAGSIVLRLSVDAFSCLKYLLCFCPTEMIMKVFFFFILHYFLKIMCVYFLQLINIFEDSRKAKNHFKKITLSPVFDSRDW